jgi:hypothetical protein
VPRAPVIVLAGYAATRVDIFINSTCMNLHIFIYFWFKFEIRLIVCLFKLDVKASY